MCKVYTGYRGTSEEEHDCASVWSIIPSLKLRTGAQTMLYLPLVPQSRDTQSLARDTP